MKSCLKYFIFLLSVTVFFSSCLKTNDLYEGFENISPIADFPLSRLSSDTLTVYALAIAPSADATVDTVFAVHLSAKDHVGNVTFQVGLGTGDSAYVKFMHDHPEYTLMPSDLYSFDSSVTIENAGVLSTATLPIRFKTASLDVSGNNAFLSNEYVLPIVLKDAGGYKIASNFRLLMMRVLAKNQFDGKYDITGTFVDRTNPDFSGDYPKTGALITQGALNNAYYDGDLDDIGYIFNTGTGLSYFGNLGAVFQFDTNGNVTGISNYYFDPAPRSRSFQLDTSPGVVNKYDFDTKTLDVSYFFLQSGAIRGEIHEVWTYKGPR